MARLDVQTYRDMYLRKVEEHLMQTKDSIPNFTSENPHKAILTEMNRADVCLPAAGRVEYCIIHDCEL